MRGNPPTSHAGAFLMEREWAGADGASGASPRLHQWPGIFARSLVEVVASPRTGFLRIREPVDHGPVLGMWAAYRLGPWLVAAVAIFAAWLGGAPLRVGSLAWLSPAVDGGLIHALHRWLFWLAPLLLLLTYVGAGMLCHLALALTGGARRSVGASMRAFGLGALPGLALLFAVEPLLVLHLLAAEVWLGLLALSSLAVILGTTRAFSQTHEIAWWRSLVVVLPAVILVLTGVGSRMALELERMPFQQADVGTLEGTSPPDSLLLAPEDAYYVDP